MRLSKAWGMDVKTLCRLYSFQEIIDWYTIEDQEQQLDYSRIAALKGIKIEVETEEDKSSKKNKYEEYLWLKDYWQKERAAGRNPSNISGVKGKIHTGKET